MKKITTIILFVFLVFTGVAQQKYAIDASDVMVSPEMGHFKMGNPGPQGREIMVNSLYMTIEGKAVLPVMGEMHFNRVKRDQWEDCILKMKACGINIISTYLFWNHHEEIEGQFNWNGDLDIRAFIELCKKHHVYAYPRIGPWSHGEMRNGGTPDWVLRKKYLKDRSNDPVYQNYVVRYLTQIGKQLEGLYYKDGGNIVGIQLENEYWYAKAGEPHIEWLKKTAREVGIDVPLYTVTGWNSGSVPPFEVIPLWGGYADEPWIEKVTKNVLSYNFMFDSFRDNKHIGNDQVEHQDEYMTYERYPYFTCEMGVGIQNTYHRRLKIDDLDGLGMLTAKLGSGSNLLGYYVFAGGTNPRGELHGTEEEQEETGYWSRVPAKSYDFQAAIKESGELAGSYRQVKKLHYFTNEFGENLAPMMPVIGKTTENELQYSVRSDNYSAYLFGINYCRYIPKGTLKDVRFEMKFKNEVLHFPQKGVDIPDSTCFIWPVNFRIGTTLLKYATAQLLGKIGDTSIFYQNRNVPVELAFDASTIDQVSVNKGKTVTRSGWMIVNELHPGKDCVINIRLKDGSAQKILLLTEHEADNAWFFMRNGQKELYISTSTMYLDGDDLYTLSTGNKVRVSHWQNGAFTDNDYQVEEKKGKIQLTPRSILSDAQWLETANFKDMADNMQRYHRYFFKEFSLDNPSDFRKATLYIYPETSCLLNTNEQWVRQEIRPNQLNIIDITGYVQKGENQLFLDFPYVEGIKKFAARIIVEYSNYDRVEFSTDISWLKTDMYTPPSPTRPPYNRPEAPTIVTAPDYAGQIKYTGFGEWELSVPCGAFNDLSALYSHIQYIGDRSELYSGYQLCADDFNANVPWQIGLQRLQPAIEGKTLRLVVYPLSKETKIFFDVMPKPEDDGKTGIKDFEVIPEYKIKIESPLP